MRAVVTESTITNTQLLYLLQRLEIKFNLDKNLYAALSIGLRESN